MQAFIRLTIGAMVLWTAFSVGNLIDPGFVHETQRLVAAALGRAT